MARPAHAPRRNARLVTGGLAPVLAALEGLSEELQRTAADLPAAEQQLAPA